MSNQDPTLELYDIYGLWHVPFWQRSSFIIGASALICLLIVVVIYFVVKKYRSRKVIVPAWQIAQQQLSKIKTDDLRTVEREPYYRALTSVLKSYISARFGTDVASLTDAQMCAYIDEHLHQMYKDNLKQIFSAGQLIKFAGRDALEVHMVNDWQHVWDFIEGTKDVAKQ